MAREWKVGDWCEYKGVRHLCYNVTSDGYGVYLVTSSAYGKGGHCSPATKSPDLKHLPDCTGWDWKPPKPIVPPKPIKPPEGYRLLEREEVVLDGDICIERAPLGNVRDWRSAGGKSIGCHAGWRMDNYGVECFARKILPPEGYRFLTDGETTAIGDLFFFDGKSWETVTKAEVYKSHFHVPHARKIEPKYRPFANAAEFAPHRDKWFKWKNQDRHVMRFGLYSDFVVVPACASVGSSFAEAFEKWTFEDGSPFGVLES